jgi:hypothetical protein
MRRCGRQRRRADLDRKCMTIVRGHHGKRECPANESDRELAGSVT